MASPHQASSEYADQAEYRPARTDTAGNVVYDDEIDGSDRGRPWIEFLTVVAGLTAIVLWPDAVAWVITALLIALGVEILAKHFGRSH